MRKVYGYQWIIGFVLTFVCLPWGFAKDGQRMRFRDLGIDPGIFRPGVLNAITDVSGVLVGHRTIVQGEKVRTGVTAVMPHPGNVFLYKVPGAVYVGNGFGKAAGFLQVRELGVIETPILLTNTLSVGTAVSALVRWTLRQKGLEDVVSVNALVGEVNDSFLNDIRGMHVTEADVFKALASASSGAVAEGNVGAGTGACAFGWKGGIGTSSRVLPVQLGGYTLGALVQANFGGVLNVAGMPVGRMLQNYPYREFLEKRVESSTLKFISVPQDGPGSCMIVLATDAPLSSRNLYRLAKRAIMGLARTGSYMSNGSGDFVIAFSTHKTKPGMQSAAFLSNDDMSPLFLAAVEAVEESVYNAMFAAESMIGRDQHMVDALPVDDLKPLFEGYLKTTRKPLETKRP